MVQALIAECHAVAPAPAATEWARVIRLYDELSSLAPTPVVALNRALAIGLGESPAMGLLLTAGRAPFAIWPERDLGDALSCG